MHDEGDLDLSRRTSDALRALRNAVHDFLQAVRRVVEGQAAIGQLTGQNNTFGRDAGDINRNLVLGARHGQPPGCHLREPFILAPKHFGYCGEVFTQRRERLLHGNAIGFICRHVAGTQPQKHASGSEPVDRHDVQGCQERVTQVKVGDARPDLNAGGHSSQVLGQG